MRTGLPALLAALLLIASGATARGAVELRQLSRDDLAALVPNWEMNGAAPGDVLFGNDTIRLLLITADRAEHGLHAGDALLLPATPQPAASPIRFSPAIGGWSKPEVGKTASVAVVRFRRDEGRWSAELSYHARESNPWIDVSTSMRNGQEKQTLELPIVDLLSHGKAKGDVWQTAVELFDKESGLAGGIVPIGIATRAREGNGGVWGISYLSADQSPSLLRKTTLRMTFRGGRPELHPYRPIAVDKEWPRGLRDDSGWHRIRPREERTIRRRLVVANGEEELRPVVEYARSDRTAEVTNGDVQVASEPAPPKRIVGQLRSDSLSISAKPKTTVPATGNLTIEESGPSIREATVLDVDEKSQKAAALPTIRLGGKSAEPMPVPKLPNVEELPPPE